jgi:uncharacterized protein (TIGR03437 family)
MEVKDVMKPKHPSLISLFITSLLLLGCSLFGISLRSSQASAVQNSQRQGGVPAQLHGGIELSAEELRTLPEPSSAQMKKGMAWMEEERREEQEEREEELRRQRRIHKVNKKSTPTASAVTNETLTVPNAPPPAPVTSFSMNVTENLAGGYLAADTNLGVSRTHVVVSSYILLEFYSKAGKRLQRLSVYDLFAPLNLDHESTIPAYQKAKAKGLKMPRIGAFFDARCLFDEYRKRFFVVALAHNVHTPGDSPFSNFRLNKFAIAVSKSENPLDGWYLFWVDAVPGDGTNYVGETALGNLQGTGTDYPLLGIDPYGFYMTCISARENSRYANLTFFPAEPMTNGTLAPGWTFGDSLRAPGATTPYVGILQPMVHHGDTATTYFLSNGSAESLLLWKLTDHLKPTMKMQAFSVPIKKLNPICAFVPSANRVVCAEADQKNSSTYSNPGRIANSNLGNEVLRAVFRNNAVYAVMNDASYLVDVPVRTDTRIVKIPSVSGAGPFTPSVDQKFSDSNLTIHNSWASLEVNENNDVGIVHGAMGTSIFPSVKYRVLANGQTTVSDAQLAKDGEDSMIFLVDHDENPSTPNQPLDGMLLHDCNGAAVDPFDDTAIWLAAPYSTKLSVRNNDNFGIWLTKVYGAKHPDLILSDLKPSQRVYHPGDQLNVAATVHNQGDGATTGNVVLTAHLSSDPSVSVLDPKLGEASVGILGANQNSVQIIPYTIPQNITPGVYWVGAFVFPAVGEYSTTNNNKFLGYPIIIRNEDANTFLPAPGTKWHEGFGFTGEVPMSGDFNGDGKDDVCAFNKTDGSVFVALSDGAKLNGSGAAARWITGFSQGNETPLVGDFNGDGKADIATLVHDTKTGPEAFEVYVALSTGAKFGPETKWHDSFSGNRNEKLFTGDFNGDGKDDLLSITTPSDGHAYVTLSDGTQFSTVGVWQNNFASVNGPEKFGVGDFNQDGRTDIASFNPNNGDTFTALSTGTIFAAKTKWQESFLGGTELALTGDFNGDGRDDASAFTRGTAGDVFIALSDGAKFAEPREKWHEVFAINTETPVVGDFNGDGADDVATFLLGSSGDVYVSLARRKGLGIVSAASFSTTAFAPDSISAVFGLNLATGTLAATATPLPTTLLGAKVTVTDRNGTARLAPLFFVSPGQINYLVPTGTVAGNATIKVEDGTGFISTGTLNVETVAPGLFTANANGQGVPAAVLLRVLANGQQRFEPVAELDRATNRFVPVPIVVNNPGEQVVLVLFGTGIRGRSALNRVTATVSREQLPVDFAGAQGLAGLDQINLLLPARLAGAGSTTLSLSVDGKPSNVVQLNFR